MSLRGNFFHVILGSSTPSTQLFTLALLLVAAIPCVGQSFSDSFNRPDGPVGNGWTVWGAGAQIAAGQLATFGQPNVAGGVARSLPVTFPLTFSFDYRTNAPGGLSGWQIGFNGEAPGFPGCCLGGNAEFALNQYTGKRPLSFSYKIGAGQQQYVEAPLVPGQEEFQSGATSHISGIVNADLSASVTITYPDATQVTIPTPAPPASAVSAQGPYLALGNSSAAYGPHYFSNFTVRPLTCDVTAIVPSGQSVFAMGGFGAFLVKAAEGCEWEALPSEAWITALPTSGSGTRIVQFVVAANTGAARSGFITVGGQHFNIDQTAAIGSPCSYSLSPSGHGFGLSGDLSSFSVTTSSDCTWMAIPSADWITIFPGGTRGIGKVVYAVAANTGPSRTGTISVGGQKYNIDQAGFSCSYSISPTFASPDNSSGNVIISVSAPRGCRWTAVSEAPWVTVSAGASGSGAGAVVLHVAPNTAGTSRSGFALIAGQQLSVTQGAGACGASDVTSQIGYFPGSFTGEGPLFNLYHQEITVANLSGAPITGPLYLVLEGLPASNGAGPSGGFPLTYCFSSKGDSLVYLSPGLSPRASLKFGIDFVLPTAASTTTLNYTPKLLSGTPSK